MMQHDVSGTTQGPDAQGSTTEAARHSQAAQRAARLFWGVLGSSGLIVGGVLAVWVVGGHHRPALPRLDGCMATLWQAWTLAQRPAGTSPFPAFVALVLGASSALAGPGCGPDAAAALPTAPPHARDVTRGGLYGGPLAPPHRPVNGPAGHALHRGTP